MRPRLLFHFQHSLGIGHLVRSLALVDALAGDFDVVVLAGGELPACVEPPADVDIVTLPPLSARRRRATLLLETARRLRPHVVVVELFPFGRKKLADELVPMLTDAVASGAVGVSSLRDILVRGRSDQEEHDDRAAGTANRLLDVVLVHSDPRFVRLEETFRPRVPLHVPVRYTGFVVPERPLPRPARPVGAPVVVSAGGGRFGGPLFRAALGAAPAIRALTGSPVRLVAGPFLPVADWRDLEQGARACSDVELVRHVPDLAAELCRARASVSQCGYNTTLDLVRSRVPALVVPFSTPGEDEQTRRADLLARLGVVRVLRLEELRPDAFAKAVAATARRPVPHLGLDLDGARRTRDLLAGLVDARLRGVA